MEMQFAFSRNGIDWQRPTRRSIIPLWSEPGPTSIDQVYCGGMVRRGDELIVYYNRVAGRHREDWKPLGPQSMIGRVVFRLDGFMSAEADGEGGEFTTPVLTFSGQKLELNAWIGSGGWIQVALLDPAGEPIPGYSIEDAVRVVGNSIRHVVQWKHGTDVGALARKPVRARIGLRDAKLFALQFTR